MQNNVEETFTKEELWDRNCVISFTLGLDLLLISLASHVICSVAFNRVTLSHDAFTTISNGTWLLIIYWSSSFLYFKSNLNCCMDPERLSFQLFISTGLEVFVLVLYYFPYFEREYNAPHKPQLEIHGRISGQLMSSSHSMASSAFGY